MTSDERRSIIFDLYSKNWQTIGEKYNWYKEIPDSLNDAVFCPICLSLFSKENLDQNLPNPLSLEHVPPKSLSGKPKILTCRKCNTDSGYMLDNNVASFYSTKPFLDMVDQSSVKSKTKIEFLDGKSVSSSAILRYVNDKTFQFHLNINKDEYRHKILEKANPSELTNIHFKFSASSPRLVQIGLLRIAYLMAFCKFGNAFILNKVYDDIRKQILNPGVDLLPSYGVVGKMKEPFEEKFI